VCSQFIDSILIEGVLFDFMPSNCTGSGTVVFVIIALTTIKSRVLMGIISA